MSAYDRRADDRRFEQRQGSNMQSGSSRIAACLTSGASRVSSINVFSSSDSRSTAAKSGRRRPAVRDERQRSAHSNGSGRLG